MNFRCLVWPRKPFSVLGPSLTFVDIYHAVIFRMVSEMVRSLCDGGSSRDERPLFETSSKQTHFDLQKITKVVRGFNTPPGAVSVVVSLSPTLAVVGKPSLILNTAVRRLLYFIL